MEEEKEVIEIKKNEDIANNETVAKSEGNRKGFCIASLILGIIALVCFCIWYISVPCAILAIIFGILGIKSEGKGMAIAGLITAIIGLLITIALFCLIIFGVVMEASNTVKNTYDLYEGMSYNYNL